ncbi:hypothetical protein E1287_32140 [Actinomadura sp. KC06]|uniref:acyl-CoA dehydrogenase family protein n=1 Tax=Actinomadura sp. KC06 TaxID=2530369 RepID=UPI001043E0B8|nr:acyl-CoA dehydrogenase [Actinomadura sp. KC06]TDD28858.1 hypothetical protein E1287_32140 [Actinomadura sp. KC06]
MDDRTKALEALAHGWCPLDIREQITTALEATTHWQKRGAEGFHLDLHDRFTTIAESLPSGREIMSDRRWLAALSEWTALDDPSLYMASIPHYAIALGSILTLAGDLDELLPQIQALECLSVTGALVVTETGDASSHVAPRATATFDVASREFVLVTPDVGAAKFSNRGLIGVPVLAVWVARVIVDGKDCGVFSFVLDIADHHGPRPGVSVSEVVELGNVPLDYSFIRLNEVRVPYERWLRDGASIDADGVFHDPLNGDARLARTLNAPQMLWGTLPGTMAAMARAASLMALKQAANRPSHGRMAPGIPVLSYHTHRNALISALAESFGLTCAGNTARRQFIDHGKAPAAARMEFSPWAAVNRNLAVLKATTVWGAEEVLTECRRRCGFAGMLNVNRMMLYYGLAQNFNNAGGDNALIIMDAGRALIEGIAYRVPDQQIAEPADPGSPQWWSRVARAWETQLVHHARRLHAERAAGTRDGLDLWNPMLPQVKELGEVHGIRLLADSVRDTLEDKETEAAREVMEPLAALHGALQAYKHAGRLMCAGLLSSDDARGLPQMIDNLCAEITTYLPTLHEAWTPPSSACSTPLGAIDYAAELTARLSWRTGDEDQ